MNAIDIGSQITSLAPHWVWLSLAALLAVAEMVAPGFFLIWMAAGAVLTGFLAYIIPGMSVPLQILIFAALAVAAVYVGRRYFAQNKIISEDPNLNNRGARIVGDIVIVVDAIEAGSGRVKVGDSVWSARGEDTPAGAKVRVTGADGSTLIVEAV